MPWTTGSADGHRRRRLHELRPLRDGDGHARGARGPHLEAQRAAGVRARERVVGRDRAGDRDALGAGRVAAEPAVGVRRPPGRGRPVAGVPGERHARLCEPARLGEPVVDREHRLRQAGRVGARERHALAVLGPHLEAQAPAEVGPRDAVRHRGRAGDLRALPARGVAAQPLVREAEPARRGVAQSPSVPLSRNPSPSEPRTCGRRMLTGGASRSGSVARDRAATVRWPFSA